MILSHKAHILDCGARVFLVHRYFTPTVSVRFSFQTSPWEEPESLQGVSFLASKMLLEGTKDRSYSELHLAFENLGCELQTRRNGFQIHCLTSELDDSLSLALEILTRPRLDQDRLDRLKRNRIEDMENSLDDSDQLSAYLLRHQVFQGTGYEAVLSGTPCSVTNIKAEDILTTWGNVFTASNLRIFAAGSFDSHKILSMLDRALSSFPRGQIRRIHAPEVEFSQQISKKFVWKDRKKVALAIGHKGVKRYSDDHTGLRILDQLIGAGGGFTSRLSQRLREELGLCYFIYGDFLSSAGMLPGLFQVQLGTNPERVQEAMTEIESVLRKFILEGPLPGEIQDVRDYLKGSLAFLLETNQAVVQVLLEMVDYNLPENFLEKEKEVIDNTGLNEIRTLAEKYLLVDQLQCVAVGKVRPEGFGEIQEIPGMISNNQGE